MGNQQMHGLTWADLQQFPENDGLRRELIDGELFVTPSPVFRHQRVVMHLSAALFDFLEPLGGCVVTAPMDVVFADTSVVEPDVLAFLPEHLDRIVDGYPRAAPDLVVEVSSPTTKGMDRVRKRALYERFAVPEYWIADLDEDVIEAYRIGADAQYGPPTVFRAGEIVSAPTLRGFAAPYERLVPRP